MCIYVCVCVRERERGRERESAREIWPAHQHWSSSKATCTAPFKQNFSLKNLFADIIRLMGCEYEEKPVKFHIFQFMLEYLIYHYSRITQEFVGTPNTTHGCIYSVKITGQDDDQLGKTQKLWHKTNFISEKHVHWKYLNSIMKLYKVTFIICDFSSHSLQCDSWSKRRIFVY